ncbi:GGDEF domain-containing protein [Pelomonas aquatica]|jgi:diguanylate cyclase (GGDEF)-like protein|uniref:diguanylate cyclase n=1 Tax=Pelomonas aquatica TaxID=431058 RepID=A0A9X4LJ33_9BURK|nr:GGDEF domain-containing protein [Pelomonas aquatica]MCY4752786.1 GGDEF domain-containing protein [Pelomonas aquatica]MDG0864515.1 GGDEF domain-containing protein [Pelomonas aquatica]
MEFLDVPTVLQVSALFNLMAALAWLLLAQLFRMAPRASRLMAAMHLVRIASQGCGDCMAGWPALAQRAVPEFGLLACAVLLLLALRRMLRSRRRPHDVAWLGGLGALAIAAGLASGDGLAPQLAGTASATLLAALAVREVGRGAGARLSPVAAALATLPFAALAGLGLAHAAELLLVPGWSGRVPGGAPPSPARAVLWFVITASITLSLIALMIWRLVTRIQHLTYRDPLTGALNRRAFEQALAEAQAQLQRGHGFAVAMIDIDHFKRINDEHGHPAGDAALRHCLRIWQAGLREVDCLGRIGGEEFCALLPLADPADLNSAAAVVERLRASLAAQPLQWKDMELQLTASFGVALPATDDPAGDVALARADAELYRAKAEGRNRVCVAQPLLSEAAPT